MNIWPEGLLGALILVCLAGIAAASLAEAGFLGLTPFRQRRLEETAGRRGRQIKRVLAEASYLSALIVAINFFVIVTATAMTLLLERRLAAGQEALREGLHLGMVLFIMVFAELTPKTYGSVYPERAALATAPFVLFIARVLRPVIVFLELLARPLTRLFGGTAHERQLLSLEEIRAAAEVVEEEGVVDAEEAEMLDSVIELGERQVREIMVPRVSIVAVPETTPVAEFAAVASRSGFSRIPIYAETLDHVTGIVYVNDVLRRLAIGPTPFTLREIARPPFYVPESKRIDDLLREMRERKIHIAIVVDEFGGTAGLVTIEDILEELVGEIVDEHDRPTEAIERISPTEAIVAGQAHIEEVNEALGCSLPEGPYETVAGLLAHWAGHIPTEGETFSIGEATLTVEEGDAQHVRRVRIRKAAKGGR